MLALLRTFSWQELRHHPWRSGAAVLAVMLGVALAFSVHLINASALDEFQGAVRAVNGQPDLELRTVQGPLPESLYGPVAAQAQVGLASPVLEAAVRLRHGNAAPVAVRLLGVDALVVGAMAPALAPVADTALGERLALVSPGRLFLNAAARQALALQTDPRAPLQIDGNAQALQVAGSVAAGGEPLAVMDIGAMQDLLGRGGELSRIDIRLAPGADARALTAALQALPQWSAQWRLVQPADSAARVSNLSRAYRVNLTVLALVALFTGAFLVFSVLALSVAKRAQQFALLGVLGLAPRARLQLVLAESLALGALGSAAGLALGTVLAWAALRLLGGDLGGGYFAGVAPSLRWSTPAALLYGALGLAAAAVGGWWPARAAQRLPEAQTLKGLSATQGRGQGPWIGLALMALGALLTQAPVVAGIPLAAYLSVGLLLVGGIAALPALIALAYDRLAPLFAHSPLPLLAVERARRMRGTAAVAVSGVVASLALSVALTVMVASFRDSVTRWLDVVLPADLYLREDSGGGNNSTGERAPFDAALVQQMARLPGVARASGTRTRSLLLDPAQPAVALVARPIARGDAAQSLPLVGAALPVPPGHIGIYVSEAMVALHGAQPGRDFAPLAGAFAASAGGTTFFVAGVWRDYVRQFGAIALDGDDYRRLTGDTRISDIALWLAPGAQEAQVQQAARELAQAHSGALLSFSSVAQLRANSLRIFDRSFAVTYWLQGVAIAIGLFGVAASFSAQVLARRKEFGLLAHLGLTRAQVLAVVAGEGAAWTAIGALAGLGLGLAVSAVLVHVVNPQSFHWTMDLRLPALRLALLCAAVVLAGTLTAWLAGRAAAGRDAVLAVKEDW
ncbi:FtsX-like permease family protein [Xenophilus arseniciresistens]|uniref:FtsX-like permease family protein n=1 Tax=Xenophilus arseniciresistens TaxID=1283306 RepID=A0AAE3N9W2_9BURK|nr:FtsX-like permease family protein [Xenophilus arseniciresistens]MDA7417249.1 FtsX-like permease family protein [Xenophilus arseniciresistens]